MKLKFPILVLGVVAGGLLSSCTVDETPNIGNSGSVLAKAPAMVAYSSDHYWSPAAGTRGTDMDANMWDQNWDCPPRPAEDLTDEELAELKALLSKGSETHNTVVLPFENYYVQQIYKSQDTYHSVDHCAREAYDGSGEIKCGGNNYCDHLTSGDHTNSDNIRGSDHMDKLVAYDGNPYPTQWDPQLGQNVPYPYGHVNNFNNGTNDNYPDRCGCGGVHYKTTLMTGMPTTGFGPEEQFGFHETFGTNHDYFNYIIVEYKGYYYVGFDYEAHKYDQNTNNHGEAMDVERDWNFTDWIVRITPAYHKGQTPEGNPGGVTTPTTPDPTPDICDKCGDATHDPGECPNEDCTSEECHPSPCPKQKCGHVKHPDYGCDVCYDEGIRNDCSLMFREWLIEQGQYDPEHDPIYDPVLDRNPSENPGYQKGRDEVEINLALDEKKDRLLESHLSIHVRTATNVKVFIPVPAQYYCNADDMEIVLNHGVGHFIHGGPVKTEYEIGEATVTLNVDFSDEGITIWTDGITQDVIDYCWNEFRDGITFEIWNYFNDPDTGLPYISLDELKEYLDQATVEFIDKTPGKYVNAFTEGKGKNGKYSQDYPEGKDFHVVPAEKHEGEFDAPYEGPHNNASEVNDIYNKK